MLVDGEVSDRRSRRTGLREVAWNDWICSINGERLFLKGANLLPTRPGLADATTGRASAATSSSPSRPGSTCCGCRPTSPTTSSTDAADELGMLLLQDFPLQWGYARQIRREAVRQAREAVDSLGHHPSIVQWCAHDEPVAEAPAGRAGDVARGRLRRFVAQQLPSWNKSVLDRWVKRSFEQADPTRPTRRPRRRRSRTSRSSTAPTRHLWFGLAPRRGRRARRASPGCVPRLVRFVSEFGAQSVPDAPTLRGHRRGGPSSTGTTLREHHGLEVEVMLERVPPSEHPTFGAWRTADPAQPGR